MQESASASAVPFDTAQAQSEIDEYLYVHEQRRRMLPRAALVGLLAGTVAVAFRAALAGGELLRNQLVAWAGQYTLGWIFPVLLGVVGATASVYLVRRFAPEATGSGIPHLEAVLRRYREMQWRTVLPVKFFGGTLAIGGGLALGREGPTVQMGGAVGAAVAEFLNASTRERLTLIAAGAGAGLAAAFNAPLAGLVFVLEELQRDFRRGVFGAALIAAATADVVARSVSGQLPVFAIPSYPVPPLSALPIFVVLGVVAGLFGVFFNRGLIFTLDWAGRLPQSMRLPVAAAVGAAAGLIAWFAPSAAGGGHHLTETILVGEITLGAIPLWFLARFLLTMTSYGTGAPGGIFAPLLVLGALIGSAVGQIAHLVLPDVVARPEIFAVVGMAAYFAAIVRAPLTGVVLILEMTGNYWQLLPLITACFSAYLVADLLRDLPIYERLLERDLVRSGIDPLSDKPIVVELEVNPGARFEGKLVRELGLPSGCILVQCRLDHQEWVPTATTRLTAHMRITAMLSRRVENGLTLLRDGCETERRT
ncbi:MAG: H(+)/Cl(-) exchange transporter ClcA [Chloroflexi bacterium]|nr:MAG: H(+)/Cl(-) exchange transporter ClcA [Chloroflexota bacterium]